METSDPASAKMHGISKAGIVNKRSMVTSNLAMTYNKDFKQEKADVDSTLPFESVMEAVSLFGGKADLRKSKFQKKRVETTLPYESVMEAVSLFGEKADLRKSKFQKKHAPKDADSLHTKEELLKHREQLENVEEAKVEVAMEARKSVKYKAGRLEETNGSKTSIIESRGDDVQNVEKTDQGRTHLEEKHAPRNADFLYAPEDLLKRRKQLEKVEVAMEARKSVKYKAGRLEETNGSKTSIIESCGDDVQNVEKTDQGRTHLQEKHAPRDADSLHAPEDLLKRRKQLENVEDAKVEVTMKARESVKYKAGRLVETNGSKTSTTEGRGDDEKTDQGPTLVKEKHATTDTDSLHVQEELLKGREQLEILEEVKVEVPCELEARKSFECKDGRLEETNGSKTTMTDGGGDDVRNVEKTDKGPTHTEEKRAPRDADSLHVQEDLLKGREQGENAEEGKVEISYEPVEVRKLFDCKAGRLEEPNGCKTTMTEGRGDDIRHVEKTDQGLTHIEDKHAPRDADSLHAPEELLKVGEPLENAEEAKVEVSYEPVEARKSFEYKAGMLEETNGSKTSMKDDVQNLEKTDQGCTHIEEKRVVWEAQLRVTKEKHMNAIAELDNARQGLAELKHELLAFLTEKGSFKQAEAALAAAESDTKKAEDLTTELEGINDALVLLKLSYIDRNKGNIFLSGSKQLDTKASHGDARELESLDHECEMVRHLDGKLLAMTNELESLQRELKSSKESEAKLVAVAAEALANLEALRLEFERTSMAEESDAASSCPTILEEVKLIVKRDEGTSLLDILELIRTESEMIKKELSGLKERDGNASTTADLVSGGLTSLKAESAASAVAETRAGESISDLSQNLEGVQADERDVQFPQAACKARSNAEQDNSAMLNAERFLFDLWDADGANIAEAAIEFAESFTTSGSGVEAGAGITISQAEYENLKRKVREAEKLANTRLLAAMTQMETERASEQKILQKAAKVVEDMENIKTAMQETLHRAEMAEAAKSAMDRELKRFRAREQRRKEKAMAKSAQQHHLNGERHHSSSLIQEPQVELLANVLNINVASEDNRTMVRSTTHRQNKPFLNSLGSYLVKRKKSPLNSVKHEEKQT